MGAGEPSRFCEEVTRPDLADGERKDDVRGDWLGYIRRATDFHQEHVELAFLEYPAEKALLLFVDRACQRDDQQLRLGCIGNLQQFLPRIAATRQLQIRMGESAEAEPLSFFALFIGRRFLEAFIPRRLDDACEVERLCPGQALYETNGDEIRRRPEETHEKAAGFGFPLRAMSEQFL